MIGTILGNRYKIIAELGSGGMAWVYLAEDLREDKKVAIKVLYPQHGQDLNFLQRFMQEAKLAMSLFQSAPQSQIVCVLDYGSDRDTHYLVMEFVQGRDLGQILQEQGSLPWQEALNIARQVGLALDHAHRHDVVHRDIKPGNIMILPDGTAKVLDFGIARARTSPDLTLSGFVGSPNYAAPEQAMGESVDIRADIYSLGIVLYKMLSGSLPFEGNTPWAVVNQHISSPPPPLKTVCPDLPNSVIRLVEKALAKRPEDRFQTPDEMVQAIEAVLAGHDLPMEAPAAERRITASQLEKLYEHAQQAIEAEAWQEAVDLFSQILKADPGYRDVAKQLSQVGEQIRLATLYRSVRRALELGHWEHALAQLNKLTELAPDYRDIHELRVKAENKERLDGGEEGATSEFPTQVNEPDSDLAEIQDSLRADREGQEKPATPARSDRRRNLLWIAISALILVVIVVALLLLGMQEPEIVAIPDTLAPTATETLTPTEPASPTATQSASPTDTRQAPTPKPTLTSVPTIPVFTPSAMPTEALSPTATITPTLLPTVEPPPRGQIAFPRFDPARGTYDVFVCRVDSTDCKRVATEASQPDFLPNGSQIVIRSWKPDDKGLILQTLSGQRIWQITNRIEAARPSVDSQGQIYVYHSREEADRQPRLYRTYNAETRPIKREASGVLGLAPSWLPDGRILYSGCLGDTCGIIVMRSDGSFPRQVAAGSTEINPEASPDGRRVVFMSQRDGNWEVYVVDVDGSDLRRLTRNLVNDGLPIWSPDGRYIAFISDRDGSWGVWVMHPDGSDQRRLFGIGGPLDGQVRGAAPHETHGWVEERISWAPLP